MQILHKNPTFRPLQMSFDTMHEVNLVYNLLGNITLESLMKVLPDANEKEANEVWLALTKTLDRITKEYKIKDIEIKYETQTRIQGTITRRKSQGGDSIGEVSPATERNQGG